MSGRGLVSLLLLLACTALVGVADVRGRQGVTISGRVTEGLGEATVADAAVRLIRSGGGEVSAGRTDQNGRFSLSSVADGRYRLQAGRPGYIGGSLGQRDISDPGHLLTIPGTSVTDLKIPVWKHAAISGQVTDDGNRPLPGVVVTAFGETVRAGRLAWVQHGSVTTDSRGTFRIATLMAGHYLVVAGRGFPEPVAPTFFPSAGSPAQALPVELAMGEDRLAVDITVPKRDTFAVTGRVHASGASPSGWSVRLTIPDGEFRSYFVAAFSQIAAGGEYRFAEIPAGDYIVEVYPAPSSAPDPWRGRDDDPSGPATPTLSAATLARGPNLVARLTVTDQNVQMPDLVVPMTFTIRGRITTEEGTAATLDPRSLPQVLAVSADGHARIPALRDPTGHFTVSGLTPGRYFLRVGAAPNGWTRSRITVGERPALDAPVDLSDRDIDDLTIYLTNKLTKISGAVRDPAAQSSDPDASVLVFPVNAGRWLDNGSDDLAFRRARAQPDGTFTLTGLPPGEYHVVGLKQEHTRHWNAAEHLAMLAPLGSKIIVGAEQQLSLTVASLPRMPGRR